MDIKSRYILQKESFNTSQKKEKKEIQEISYILIHYVRPSFTYLLLLSIPGPFFFGTLFFLLFTVFLSFCTQLLFL